MTHFFSLVTFPASVFWGRRSSVLLEGQLTAIEDPHAEGTQHLQFPQALNIQLLVSNASTKVRLGKKCGTSHNLTECRVPCHLA